MNERINNICRVEVARRSEVASFYETPTGLAVMSATWSEVPLARNASMSINRVYTGAGYRFDVELSANLSQSWLVKELALVRIYFADDTEPMLIGSMDFPVRFGESHSLTSKRLEFSHSNSHYPYRISPDSPSGSSSGSGV